MIKAQSILKIVDNSGGRWAKCIKVRGKSPSASANLGDTVVVSIQSLRQRYRSQVRARVNKSDVFTGILVQTRRISRQMDGRFIGFGNNSIVLLSPQGKLVGTRVATVLPRELRRLKWSKLGVLARGFV